MILECVRITGVAAQYVRLAQLHEILMPVQLPRDLLITCNSGVEIVELAPVLDRNSFAAHRLEMPVDWIAETQVFQTQQIELPFADSIGLFDDPLRGFGPARFQFGSGRF